VLRYPSGVETPSSPRTHRLASTRRHSGTLAQPSAARPVLNFRNWDLLEAVYRTPSVASASPSARAPPCAVPVRGEQKEATSGRVPRKGILVTTDRYARVRRGGVCMTNRQKEALRRGPLRERLGGRNPAERASQNAWLFLYIPGLPCGRDRAFGTSRTCPNSGRATCHYGGRSARLDDASDLRCGASVRRRSPQALVRPLPGTA
jgi:hypothetical protein